MISSDLYGPFKAPTYNNKKDFITFLNKRTRFLEVRLLENKTKVLLVFLEFKVIAENNLKGYKIRIFNAIME